jgi:acylphosphatase
LTAALARWKIVAKGSVQSLPYKERVLRAAASHRIVGRVKNDPEDDESVLIDAQGSPADLTEFLQTISGPEGRTDAREVTKVKVLPADPSRLKFRIKRGEIHQEMLERLEATGHAVTGVAGAVDTLGKDVHGGHAVLHDSLADISKSFDLLQNESQRGRSEVEQRFEKIEESLLALTTTLTNLSSSIDAYRTSLEEKVEGIVDAGTRANRDLAGRLDRLQESTASAAKSLAKVQEGVDALSETLEQETRSADQRTAAILLLAGKGGNPKPAGLRRTKAER